MAMKMAEIEYKSGVRSSYYFRITSKSFDENVIERIIRQGHEVGYHYEDLSRCKGDYEAAVKSFEKNLQRFRKLYPVKTMCMHGSPLSRWDNRLLWEKYDYRSYGIIAEPYFDLDFGKILYITEAGRSWNNNKVNFRDRVETCFRFDLTSGADVINFIRSQNAPSEIMINTHPNNWSDNSLDWWKIFLWQNVKNLIKRPMIMVFESRNLITK
jgi:hypothetical protein